MGGDNHRMPVWDHLINAKYQHDWSDRLSTTVSLGLHRNKVEPDNKDGWYFAQGGYTPNYIAKLLADISLPADLSMTFDANYIAGMDVEFTSSENIC